MQRKDRHPVGAQTGVFRQDVHLTIRMFVDGPSDTFTMTRRDLQDRIAEHVQSLVPARLHKGIVEIYAGRGPSGSRFYHPGEEIDETGLWVSLDKLP